MHWLGKRLREPSSYGGAGVFLTGLGVIFADASEAIEAGLPWWAGLLIALGGAIGMIVGERGA